MCRYFVPVSGVEREACTIFASNDFEMRREKFRARVRVLLKCTAHFRVYVYVWKGWGMKN